MGPSQKMAEYYPETELDFVDWLVPGVFCLNECAFLQVTESKALIRFLKAIMCNAKREPPDSHHKILSLQFRFSKMFRSFVRIKSLSGAFAIAIEKIHFS